MELVTSKDTVFKIRAVDSTELTDEQKVSISEGKRFKIELDEPAPAQHVKVILSEPLAGKDTWYVFSPHVTIEGTEADNKPKDPATPDMVKISPQKVGPFQLPGFSSTFYLSDPVRPGGNFSWAEVTKNGQRIPVNKSVVERILIHADGMQDIRIFLGDRGVTVNSWYRDPVTNRRVGGASRSRHLSGDACDFTVAGLSPGEVNRRLESFWRNRGGLASASVFTHVDSRGYRARWSYGF